MTPISSIEIIDTELTEDVSVGTTDYCIDFERGLINGQIEDIEALKQAVYMRLNTELNLYNMYTENYGLPMNDLIGQAAPLVYVLIANAISETLLEDKRILSVSDFIFDTTGTCTTVNFRIQSIFGDVEIEELSI